MPNNQPVLVQTIPAPVTQVGAVNNQNVKITLTSHTFTAIIKSLNIRIEARRYFYRIIFVNYNVFVPRRACERSYGHLGNCDGNPNNDVSIAGQNDRK